jgi:hypothetical protein
MSRAGDSDRREVEGDVLECVAPVVESTTAKIVLINASKSLNTVKRSKAYEMVGLLRCRRQGDVHRFSDR